MRFREGVLWCVLLLVCADALGAGKTLSGVVYEDRDGDGRRGRSEPGIPGVAMSNGRDLVVADADGLRGYDRSPEAWISPHLWRGTLPTDLATGAHRIEVRAFDPWRSEIKAQSGYRLQDEEG